MTKVQARKKCKELAGKVKDDLVKKIEQLMASGGIDLDSYEDNYIAPRILLAAALVDEADQFMVRDCDKKAVNNLKYF